METPRQPDNESGNIAPSEKTPSIKELALKLFTNFWEKKDESTTSYEDQQRLAEESARAAAIFQEEKTESAKIASDEATKKFLESKSDKKRINAIFAPLGAALFYLESEESESIPEAKRKELIDKIKDLYADLENAREQENISDELISKVLGVMDEIKIYLQ